MAEHHHRSPQELTQEIRTAVHGVTGIGDVIRGTVNSSLDDMFPDKETDESRAKNAGVTNKGRAEVEAAEKLFAAHKHHHGSAVGSHQGTSHDAVTTEATPVAHEAARTTGTTEKAGTTVATSTGPGASISSGVEKPTSGAVSHEGIAQDTVAPEATPAVREEAVTTTGTTGTGTGTSTN